MSHIDVDIIHPTQEYEQQCNKQKILVPNPTSNFLSLCCPSCGKITTAFSQSNIPIVCQNCNCPLAFPTGGRLKFVEGVEVSGQN